MLLFPYEKFVLHIDGISKTCNVKKSFNLDEKIRFCRNYNGNFIIEEKGKNYAKIKKIFELEIVVEKNKEQEKIKLLSESGKNLREVLIQNNIEIGEKDIVSEKLDRIIDSDMQITIKKEKKIKLDIFGEIKEILTQKERVSEIMDEFGIVKNNDIKILPENTEYISDGDFISFLQIGSKTVEEKEEIKFETIRIPKSDLEIGKEEIVETGENGEIVRIYEVKTENEKIIYKKLIREYISKDVKNKIIYFGTKTSQNESSNNSESDYQIGIASHYGYNYGTITNGCASTKYPKGTKLLVTNLSNGKSVICIVNDWGPDPKIYPDRIIDLSFSAFSEIELPSIGIAKVRVEKA